MPPQIILVKQTADIDVLNSYYYKNKSLPSFESLFPPNIFFSFSFSKWVGKTIRNCGHILHLFNPDF